MSYPPRGTKRGAQDELGGPPKRAKVERAVEESVLPAGLNTDLARYVDAKAGGLIGIVQGGPDVPHEPEGIEIEPDVPDEPEGIEIEPDVPETEPEDLGRGKFGGDDDEELVIEEDEGDEEEVGDGASQQAEPDEGEHIAVDWEPADSDVLDESETESGGVEMADAERDELRELYRALKKEPVPAMAYIDPNVPKGGDRLFKLARKRPNTMDAIRALPEVKQTQPVMANQVGMWMEHGFVSGRAPMAARRDRQLLNQLSQMLIDRVGATNTAEIQAMVINGRILVSINEASNVATLSGIDLKGLLDAAAIELDAADTWQKRKARKLVSLTAALALSDNEDFAIATGTDDPDAEPDANPSPVAVGADRLARIEADCALIPAQRQRAKAILATLREARLGDGSLVDGGKPAQAAKLIDDPKCGGRVIVVRAMPDSHAEQNLVWAAALSGAKFAGPITVAGGKRPCVVCWLTLNLARGCGMDLRFNPNPGGYWSTTAVGGLFRTAQALGFTHHIPLARALIAICGMDGIRQHVTDLDEDTLGTKPTELIKAIKKGTYSTITSTPSQSPDPYRQ